MGNGQPAPLSALIQEYWIFKGQRLILRENGLEIFVKVLDVRRRWNTLDALITPEAGNGERWIEARRLQHSI